MPVVWLVLIERLIGGCFRGLCSCGDVLGHIWVTEGLKGFLEGGKIWGCYIAVPKTLE
jgi:hypothetical protein